MSTPTEPASLDEYRRKRDFSRTPEPSGSSPYDLELRLPPTAAVPLKCVDGPREAPLPDYISPKTATLAGAVPSGEDWLHETTHGGLRLVCRIDREGKGTRFFTAKGNDVTDRVPSLVPAVSRLAVKKGWLDGEIVFLNAPGKTASPHVKPPLRNGWEGPFVYLVFDLMYYEGYDLRGVPLSERKGLLAALIPIMAELRYVEHVVGGGEAFFETACRSMLKGVVSKRLDSEYTSTRTGSWVKVMCAQRKD